MTHMFRRALFLFLMLPAADLLATDVAYDVATLKGALDGIPMHTINVRTHRHDDAAIELDGIVDEPVWQQTPWFDNMLQSTPGTGEASEYRTETRFIATEKGLYVSSVMYQPPESIIMRMSKRDDLSIGDRWGFTLDPGGEGNFAYWFSLALGDSVQDGKVLPERRYSSDWDGPWYYKTARFDEGWSIETFFPWSIFSLPEREGDRQIGFAVNRSVTYRNNRYYWPGHTYSSPQFVTALNTMNVADIKPRPLLAAIPYVSATSDSARGEDEIRGGVDITWKPSPAAALTASIYPDFGAVEADDVVLNLTARETFFPEKRLFFLEGNEIFETTPRANSGNALRELTNENFAVTSRRIFMMDFVTTPISLLNTRRIGGTATQVTLPPGVTPNRGETGVPTDLLGAVKLVGEVNDFNYGIFGVAEDDVDWLGTDALGNAVDIGDDGRNFGIVRLNYEKTAENRYAIGYLGTIADGPLYQAKVHGLDLHYGTGDGKWAADLQLIHSDVDGVTGRGALLNIDYSLNSRFQHLFKFDYLDEDIDINDLGFLQRNDVKSMQYVFRYVMPKVGDFIERTRGAVSLERRYNISEGDPVDSGLLWRNTMEMKGRYTLRTGLGWFPERYEDLDSRGNGTYKAEDRFWWKAMLNTDSSKPLSWTFEIGGLQEDLGDWTRTYRVGFTARPSDSVVVDFDVNYKRRDGWVVYQGGRNFGAYNGIDWQPTLDVNWFIAPGHQLRAKLQWAGVRVDEQGFYAVPTGNGRLESAERTRSDHDFSVSLLTAQIRYRWEIAPLTDLYVVYNIGNRLPFRTEDQFSNLFEASFDDPIIDAFIIKLRYRFGN